jgi:hypothetical protein
MASKLVRHLAATKLFLKALVEVQATSLLRRQNSATKLSC